MFLHTLIEWHQVFKEDEAFGWFMDDRLGCGD
jgi:hypothetical protein